MLAQLQGDLRSDMVWDQLKCQWSELYFKTNNDILINTPVKLSSIIIAAVKLITIGDFVDGGWFLV